MQTLRDPDFPWIFLSSMTGDRPESGLGTPDDHLVLAREDLIKQSEMRYVSIEPDAPRQVGFSVGELSADE